VLVALIKGRRSDVEPPILGWNRGWIARAGNGAVERFGLDVHHPQAQLNSHRHSHCAFPGPFGGNWGNWGADSFRACHPLSQR